MAPSTEIGLRDKVAKSLWSGEVREEPNHQMVGNLSTSDGMTYQKEYPISKDDGLRRGTVPQHINSPQAGRPRSFDPFKLRKLADTETVQAAIDTIINEIKGIPRQVVPRDEEAGAPEQLMTEIDRALDDINPNPESWSTVNEMLLRDALEVGNCVAVTNLQVDGRRAEVVPHDPNTFTVQWDSHRILNGFYQYPASAQGRFGEPTPIDVEQVMWGTLNPETSRAGFYGHSPVEKVANIINVLGGLVEREVKELEEGVPSGIMTLIGDEWNDEDYSHFETYWEEEIKGSQHKLPYTRGEADFVPFNMSYKELQVLDRQKWYTKLVGAVFGVPVSETGIIIGDLNRATDVSQRQRFKNKTIRPLLQMLEDLWTVQYVHRWWSEDVRVTFDTGLDLMERKELASIHSTYLRNGTVTINEVREELGKDPVEWGDDPFDRRSYARTQYNTETSQDLLDEASDLAAEEVSPDTQGEQTPTEQQEQSQEEGQTPGSGDDTNFKTAYPEPITTGSEGTWVGKNSDEPLRSTDSPHQFNFQPKEIEALEKDLQAVFEDHIESVMDQVRGNQHLLRGSDQTVEKGPNEFVQLIRDEIGATFAEETAEVLTTHKVSKILDGEKDILQELEGAGLTREAVELDTVRDRVTTRIQKRTLKVTKPISQRLEQDLRDTLTDGWNEGKGITGIERDIEELTDKWQGTDAERLARDQLGKASKEGRMEYAKETEAQVGGWEKTWLATGGLSGDGRTRDSHANMHGTTVPRSEPFIVNYAPDGGPMRVEEEYPGQSRWGIQCRCDYSLSVAGTAEQVTKWAEDKTQRMQEIEEEQGKPISKVMMGLELDPEVSRNQAAKDLGISKRTYYKWAKEAGLMDS